MRSLDPTWKAAACSPLKKCPQMPATPTGHRSVGRCREQQSKAELLQGLWEGGPHPNSLVCCFQSSCAWAGTGFLLGQWEEGKGRAGRRPRLQHSFACLL